MSQANEAPRNGSAAQTLTPTPLPGERKKGEAPRVLAVMYHYVRDADPLPLPDCGGPFDGIKSLSTADFTAQLDALCRTMEPIDWPRLYAWVAGRASLPSRCFLLTFDDGLTDHVSAVAPRLEERGLRGAFFVPGSVLTSHRLLAPHANHLLLATLGEERVVRALAEYLEACGSANGWHEEARALAEAPADAAAMGHHQQPLRARLKQFLTMRLPISLRDAAMASIFERHIGSTARWAKHWYLGWKDLRRLVSAGHTVGGHGFAHEPLARLTEEEVMTDVRRSAEVLREGLGPDPRPFSYPYGSVPRCYREALAAGGFVHAFTIEERLIAQPDDALRLPRYDAMHAKQAIQPHHAFLSVR